MAFLGSPPRALYMPRLLSGPVGTVVSAANQSASIVRGAVGPTVAAIVLTVAELLTGACCI